MTDAARKKSLFVLKEDNTAIRVSCKTCEHMIPRHFGNHCLLIKSREEPPNLSDNSHFLIVPEDWGCPLYSAKV